MEQPRAAGTPTAGTPTAGTGDDRYRCADCGNLTRFDVTVTRRTREYHHFTVGGELDVEDRELLDERVEDVTCRWCGASGVAIELVPVEAPVGES